MILSKMSHPPKALKKNCRKSKRAKDKQETACLVKQARENEEYGINQEEDIFEGDWYDDFLEFEDECRQEIEDEMFEEDMAIDDYEFKHRLGEYEGWREHDANQLDDYY